MSIKVGIISSRFNQLVVDELLQACLDKLKEHGLESDQIFHQTVPGALEIPLALDLLALSKKYDVLIADWSSYYEGKPIILRLCQINQPLD
jgi:6,7-dimethyl-8-ribityllumazine synthase